MPNGPDSVFLDATSTTLVPPTIRAATSFANTAPLPAFQTGDVTRMVTSIGAGAAAFAEAARGLITTVQRWIETANLAPHEVFLLGRRLERLRLAAHAPARTGSFAFASARAALAALPHDRVTADVAAAARRLAEVVARGNQPSSPSSSDKPTQAPAPEHPLPERRPSLRVLPALLVVSAMGVSVWYALRANLIAPPW